MSNKSYTVRVSGAAPDIGSDIVAQWLESHLASPADLAPDPGAGERSLRLALDREKVEQAARAAGEPEATFLRRLIATHVGLPTEDKPPQAAKDEPRPKATLLKGALKLCPDQIRPLVRTFEAGQSFAIRRAFGVPQAVKAAAYTEEEREELSTATCEVLNRRAPRVLVENIDLFGLFSTIVAIEARKIEQVQVVAEQIRQQRTIEKRGMQPQAPSQAAHPSTGVQNLSQTPQSPGTRPNQRPPMIPFEPIKAEAAEGVSLESDSDFINGGTGIL